MEAQSIVTVYALRGCQIWYILCGTDVFVRLNVVSVTANLPQVFYLKKAVPATAGAPMLLEGEVSMIRQASNPRLYNVKVGLRMAIIHESDDDLPCYLRSFRRHRRALQCVSTMKTSGSSCFVCTTSGGYSLVG